MSMELDKKARTYQFENREFLNDEIEQIAKQTRLVGLSFESCPITDEHIKTLAGLPKLINLSLKSTQITDKSFAYLANIPTLKYLFIDKAAIDGDGLVHFKNHKKLDTLWLDNTHLNDDTIKHLKDFKKLGAVRINNTKVTYTGLLSIAENHRLKVIAEGLFSADEMSAFEAEQRKLNKKRLSFNKQDIEIAKTRLLDFFAAMTAWEKLAENGFEEDKLAEDCIKLFKTYCTDKQRKGFRPYYLSFSYGPNYSYANHEIVDFEQATKNKLFIYTKDTYLNDQYRFCFLKKDDWLLDDSYMLDSGWKKNGL